MASDFPFTIKDVAYLLNLHIRHKNAVSLDVNCPFCGETKGKMNLNLKKNVFKCNRCGETGGMLALYGNVYHVDNQTAYKEIMEALGENRQTLAYPMKTKKAEPEIINAMAASADVKDKTYTALFSMLWRQAVQLRGYLVSFRMQMGSGQCISIQNPRAL